jgi:hypothetical protein
MIFMQKIGTNKALKFFPDNNTGSERRRIKKRVSKNFAQTDYNFFLCCRIHTEAKKDGK